MEGYAAVMNYAIPFFLILIAIEYGVSRYRHREVNRLFDTVSSLSSGITNVVKDVLGLVVIIVSYDWLYRHLALIHPKSEWMLYVLAFVGLDFAGYWIHRWSHEINLFWNRHIIHHSSEEFNLACALRQSVSEIFALFTFMFIPMALLGVPPEVVGVVAPLQLFAQFWYHTQLIGHMGFLEHIIVTPSHHRVHHSINPRYMDKNYSQVFIIWDKLFGTFQEELADEPPVYGVTRAVRTWNPWLINFQHMWLMVKDAWRTGSVIDKLRIWFMPTGWRPTDVAEKYPVMYTSDVYHRPRYHTEASGLFKVYISFQLIVTLALMMFMFNNISSITPTYLILYGVFIFVSVFANTSLMDGSLLGPVAEGVRLCLGLWLIVSGDGTWFGIDSLLPGGTIVVTSYLLVSAAMATWFYLADRPVEKDILPDLG